MFNVVSVVVYFVMTQVRKLLDTPSYVRSQSLRRWIFQSC